MRAATQPGNQAARQACGEAGRQPGSEAAGQSGRQPRQPGKAALPTGTEDMPALRLYNLFAKAGVRVASVITEAWHPSHYMDVDTISDDALYLGIPHTQHDISLGKHGCGIGHGSPARNFCVRGGRVPWDDHARGPHRHDATSSDQPALREPPYAQRSFGPGCFVWVVSQ